MKLAEHVEQIRQLIDQAFRNRLGRMGISATTVQPLEKVPEEYRADRNRIESIMETLIAETGSDSNAYEKLVEEFTFTLFNRMAALKVMEAHTLNSPIVTRSSQHGDRSFAHFLWLEQNPEGRNEEQEGLLRFMEEQLTALAYDIPLFSPRHPYHLLPTAIEVRAIMDAFNQVEKDDQLDNEIWKNDDVLGWLYESYNNYKKAAHKESKAKTEYNKVSIQSQVYTPSWVVKFLVDNSLGKLYLEMFPDSSIKENCKIANAPATQTRDIKPLTEIKLIDPACGSGNFLLYAFDLLYDLYTDQIENYGAKYDENQIPKLIIEHNLHGIDLDDRAVQLAQLGLYIKVKRKKRLVKIEQFNIVSSDFFLPDYSKVKHLFENGEKLSPELEKIVIDLWADLQQAHKFGSLIRLEEKFNMRLHGMVQQWGKGQLFEEQTLAYYEQFRENFFVNLHKAVVYNTEKHGITFLNSKTRDAISFLQLLTQKYDVAVANPPYTDSSDFGPELKKFVEANYRKPYKFNSNLYASFIKRCCELTDETGYVALIHPHTFMFIKTFEDVRKYMIEHTHIELLVDYGLDRVNLFGPGILLDAAWYVLCKKEINQEGVYFNITANQQEKFKKASLLQAFDDMLNNRKNERVYKLTQSKLKIIEGWPFIYWISDGFREKFLGNPITKIGYPTLGLKTANNNKYLRFWWEVTDSEFDCEKWVPYAKGGEYQKWFGNVWLLINWLNNGELVRNQKNSQMIEKGWDFREGVSLSTRSVKGSSARFLCKDWLFDMAASSIISIEPTNTHLIMSFSNSKLFNYILDSLNPTVNIQPEDIRRVPLVLPENSIQDLLKMLSAMNVNITKYINSYRFIEIYYNINPLTAFKESSLRERLLTYLNYENAQLSIVLTNEAIINKLIFNVFNLSPDDRKQVENKEGKSVGELPLLAVARDEYLLTTSIESETAIGYIQNLATTSFDEEQIRNVKDEFVSLYQSNNDLEEFCIRHQLNPINVWYWFRESQILPPGRAAEIALEFLADICRTVLMEDEDGIIPLVGLPGEPRLLDRLEQHCLNNGFTSAQFMQLDGLLGRPINEYIEHYFFKHLSDHLNLFMYLPKTPFIWHLSSGPQQGFEAYIIIYKWNRDSLFKLKTQYLSKRIENLEFRQIQLVDTNTAQAQNEKEKIRLQIQEIAEFTARIDELISEGYDPKLDDGVGKNIAPLQKKGLLRCEVLNAKQLEKYLKADW